MVRTIVHYACEICGSEYQSQELANICASYKMIGPPPVEVGQTVYVYERYGEPQQDKVAKVEVGPSYFAGIHPDSPEGVERWRRLPQHEYRITVGRQHRMSKDEDSCTNAVEPGAVTLSLEKADNGRGFCTYRWLASQEALMRAADLQKSEQK